MLVTQELPTRYIDMQKLAKFWQTDGDFKGKGCAIVETRQDFYVVKVPREMTKNEIRGVYYDKDVLARMYDDDYY